MSAWILSALILVSGFCYLAFKGNLILRYILKPGTMLLIIGLALTRFDPGDHYGSFILLGLAFSVAGDVFLMLPADRFIQGLASFFLAHVMYIVAFGGPLTLGSTDLPVLGALAAFAAPLFLRFRQGVMRSGGRPMLIAVWLYILVICAMVWRAAAAGNPVAAAGAVLFLISDALLAWNRFAGRLWWADYGVMSAYWGAQYCLALSLA